MSGSRLDRLVKGAPPPNLTAGQVAGATGAPRTSDPTTLLPSSPPQIYLNLLILEASLRSQYLSLRARRRQNTFVLLLLALWVAYSTHLVFLRPREDGAGRGGSRYWLVDTAQKVSFIGGLVMAALFWATGQWERGIRWPRRWLGVANRGLRPFNCKLALIRGAWWREWAGHLGWLLPYSLVFPTPGAAFCLVDYGPAERRAMLLSSRPRLGVRTGDGLRVEEDVAPGGDAVRLLLLPKPFAADFREAWDSYRAEYWERENERRALLRRRHRARRRELARQQGGWLWWTGWRGWAHARGVVGRGVAADVEKTHAGAGGPAHGSSGGERPAGRPGVLRGERGRDSSRSRSSSSSTVAGTSETEEARERRLSGGAAAGGVAGDGRRRRPPTSAGSGDGSAKPTRLASAASPSRPTAPALVKRSSTLSTDSDRSSTLIEEDKATPEPAA